MKKSASAPTLSQKSRPVTSVTAVLDADVLNWDQFQIPEDDISLDHSFKMHTSSPSPSKIHHKRSTSSSSRVLSRGKLPDVQSPSGRMKQRRVVSSRLQQTRLPEASWSVAKSKPTGSLC